MIQSLHVQVGETQIYYLEKPSDDPVTTVVFIHGFPFSSEMWRNQLESLPQEVRGIAYDIRGFGNSDSGHRFFSVDLFAKDLLALIKNLSIVNPILCGISMGGYIALRTVQLENDLIAGLVLSDTNAIADTDESKIKRFQSIEQIINGDKEVFTEAFLKNVFFEETVNRNPEAIDLIRKLIINTSDSTICSSLLALASRTDTSEFLDQIKCPVLVLRGEYDKLMNQKQTDQLVENIKVSEFASIPEAGHLPNLENPEIFNSYLNHFLTKHFLS